MPIRPRKPGAASSGGTSSLTPDTSRASTITISARPRLRPVQPDQSDTSQPPSPPSPPPVRAHHKVDRTTANWTEDGDYLVGKGRPPKEHRWQKGQSGNPRGPKPAEKLDPQAQFERTVLAMFPAKVNGADVSLSLGEFGLNVLKGAAAKGSRHAASYLIELYLQTLRKTADIPVGAELLADEQAAVDALLDQLGLDAAPVRRKTDRTVANDAADATPASGDKA